MKMNKWITMSLVLMFAFNPVSFATDPTLDPAAASPETSDSVIEPEAIQPAEPTSNFLDPIAIGVSDVSTDTAAGDTTVGDTSAAGTITLTADSAADTSTLSLNSDSTVQVNGDIQVVTDSQFGGYTEGLDDYLYEGEDQVIFLNNMPEEDKEKAKLQEMINDLNKKFKALEEADREKIYNKIEPDLTKKDGWFQKMLANKAFRDLIEKGNKGFDGKVEPDRAFYVPEGKDVEWFTGLLDLTDEQKQAIKDGKIVLKLVVQINYVGPDTEEGRKDPANYKVNIISAKFDFPGQAKPPVRKD
jgi:hypothetical protein